MLQVKQRVVRDVHCSTWFDGSLLNAGCPLLPQVCGARQRACTMASPPLELMVAVADLVTVVEREASAAAAIQARDAWCLSAIVCGSHIDDDDPVMTHRLSASCC